MQGDYGLIHTKQADENEKKIGLCEFFWLGHCNFRILFFLKASVQPSSLDDTTFGGTTISARRKRQATRVTVEACLKQCTDRTLCLGYVTEGDADDSVTCTMYSSITGTSERIGATAYYIATRAGTNVCTQS